MIALTDSYGTGYVSLKSIANREDISFKYVEAIMKLLVDAKLVEGKIGKSGGYQLVKSPKDYKASEILEVTEGSLSPVSCQTCEKECKRHSYCKTLPLWEGLEKLIKDYLDSVSLYELSKNSERFSFAEGI